MFTEKEAEEQVEYLKSYLTGWTEYRETMKAIGETRLPHKTIDELVYEHGELMMKRGKLLAKQIHPNSKECYFNAWGLMERRPELTYCEGYIAIEKCPIPVLHGWCINVETQEVFDPSVAMKRGIVYWGVKYRSDFAQDAWRRLRRNQLIGILPNLWLFDEPEEWLIAGLVK